ncbi:YpzI family protein [Bacillus nitroreducens]
MGRDRQERKQKKIRLTESDRDQSIDYPGATRLDTPEEAREDNQINP